MKRLFYLLIIVSVVVVSALPAGAIFNPSPPPPDPGPGGYTCVTNCTECHYSCSPNQNCVWFCADTSGNGGCGCEFSGDHAEYCADAGTCTYE